MEEKLKMYVITKDGDPTIRISSNRHKAFSKEALDDTLDAVEEFAEVLRSKWDKDDWFPCGFVMIKADRKCHLVTTIKAWGQKDEDMDKTWRYRCLTLFDNDDVCIHIKAPVHDAITFQCMRYKSRLAEEFQKLLAFLGIRVEVRSMID